MSNETPDDVLTAQEVGRLLKLKTVTVYAAAADGRIPSVTLWKGKRRSLLRFRREDIDALLRPRSA
jgi:excisionase family DNA binding protein